MKSFAKWVEDGISTFLTRFFPHYEIGRHGDLYLIRWDILGTRFSSGPKLFLHRFYRSDSEAGLHDHPWNFWSLILWGGYFEQTEGGKTWHGPLSLLRRPASWRHRVVMPSPGVACWTLIWASDKKRSWFFYCPAGPVPWREFVEREDAGQPGCG